MTPRRTVSTAAVLATMVFSMTAATAGTLPATAGKLPTTAGSFTADDWVWPLDPQT